MKWATATPNTERKGNGLKTSVHPDQLHNKSKAMTEKYRNGMEVQAKPTVTVDLLGTFWKTEDGLSGLVYENLIMQNKELSLAIPTMIEKGLYITLKIVRYNKLGDGKVGFEVVYNEATKKTIHDASGDMTPYEFKVHADPVNTAITPATLSKTSQEEVQAEAQEVAAVRTLEAIQEPTEGIQAKRQVEYLDMKQFIETKLGEPLSSTAQQLLAKVVDESNMFKLFLATQEGIEQKDDKGLQLIAMIKVLYDAKLS